MCNSVAGRPLLKFSNKMMSYSKTYRSLQSKEAAPPSAIRLIIDASSILIVLFCSGLESESKFDDTESIKILASE